MQFLCRYYAGVMQVVASLCSFYAVFVQFCAVFVRFKQCLVLCRFYAGSMQGLAVFLHFMQFLSSFMQSHCSFYAVLCRFDAFNGYKKEICMLVLCSFHPTISGWKS